MKGRAFELVFTTENDRFHIYGHAYRDGVEFERVEGSYGPVMVDEFFDTLSFSEREQFKEEAINLCEIELEPEDVEDR